MSLSPDIPQHSYIMVGMLENIGTLVYQELWEHHSLPRRNRSALDYGHAVRVGHLWRSTVHLGRSTCHAISGRSHAETGQLCWWGGRRCPLSSEYGTYKTVTARLWPWLSDKSFKLIPLRSEADGKYNPVVIVHCGLYTVAHFHFVILFDGCIIFITINVTNYRWSGPARCSRRQGAPCGSSLPARLVFYLLLSSLLLSSLELSDTQSLWALNTSPPRNRCRFLWRSWSQI